MSIRRLLLVVMFCVCSVALFAQDFLVPLPQPQDAAVRADKKTLVNQITREKSTKSVRLMKANVELLARDSFRLELRPDLKIEAVRTKIERRSDTDYTWFGSLSQIPGSAILVVRDGNVTGTIRSDKGLFKIKPLGGGAHALVEVDESKLPEDEPPSQRDREKREIPQAVLRDQPTADSPADSGTVIEVLVAYTPSAETASGNIAGLIQLAIDETNQSYQNSGINLRLHLANTHKVHYSELGHSFDMIVSQFATPGDGLMDEIQALRVGAQADVAVLLINQTDFCGLARTIRATTFSGFAIVHYDCATGYYSFGHEIGHLQGARHDPATDPTNTPFTYGHGFRNGSNWRTVMAYNCSPSCPRIQYWSNPNVNYNGSPTGTTGTNNNARVLNETGTTVSGFGPSSGAIWHYTGTPCSGNSCPGWIRLDNNPKSSAIAAGGDQLYQLHNDGWIWRYTGTPCNGNSCPGWSRLDNNPRTITIAAAGDQLYQLHDEGSIWRYTGTPCNGNSCPGWSRLDNNPRTIAIAAAGDLYQLHDEGSIWRYTGTPCNGNSCPGWIMLDNNPKGAAIATGGNQLYQLHNDGWIWRYTGTPCNGNSCPGWLRLDNNPKTVAITAAGDQLYQLHNDGWIWRFTGTPCSGNSCPGWVRLDNNPKSIAIYAAQNQLYQLHDDGWIWRYTGTPCNGNSCPGWERLDNNPRTEGIAAAGNQLYQIH